MEIPEAANPPAHQHPKEDPPSHPRPSPGPAAAEPSSRSAAGQDPDTVPGSGLDAHYEQLRHAALHARAEAFPLGFAVLTRRGVTAWRHTLAKITPTSGPHTPAAASTTTPAPAVPGPIAAELVNALAAVALAGS